MPDVTPSQPQLFLESDLPEEETPQKPKIVRPDRNLEKWPIWEPSNSRHAPKARLIQREIQLPDGSKAIAAVEVGFSNKGVLTTEDQKTCYGLIKIWEDLGRPTEPVTFSRQQLAKILKKSWGSKVNTALTGSLMRLRFTPFTWERSYYDNTSRETVERIDTFNILSELHLARRSTDGRTTREPSFFQFNDRMLRNLLSNFTKPVFLDTILSFQSEVAQLLYTHLDLVLSDKNHYERRSKELFEDLGIDGTSYRYVSKRAQILEPALKELQGKPLPTGTLREVTLEKTADGRDLKIVARKDRPRGPKPGMKAKPVNPAPVVSVMSPAALPPTVAERETSAEALIQVRHFYQVFFKTGDTAHPTSREIAQAQDHLTRLGEEKSRYLVTFAYRESKRTDFAIQTYGGVLQYETRAIGEYEDNLQKRSSALLEKARRGHQERFQGVYLGYLRETLTQQEKSPGAAFLAFQEEEAKERLKFRTGPLAKHPSMERVARSFEEEEARLKRFSAYFEKKGGSDRVLDFWGWDATLNPERFNPEGFR